MMLPDAEQKTLYRSSSNCRKMLQMVSVYVKFINFVDLTYVSRYLSWFEFILLCVYFVVCHFV